MKEKININDLYVVCSVCQIPILIEPWVQYESMGKELQKFVISPKMHLVQKKKGEGKASLVLVESGEEVNPIEPSHSYVTRSSPRGSMMGYLMCEAAVTGGMIMTSSYSQSTIDRVRSGFNQYGYIMPFKEYLENVLKIEINSQYISIGKAKFLLSLVNSHGKRFALSENEQEAEMQIKRKIRRK